MAQVLVNRDSLSAIANAIRAKSTRASMYKPSEMAEAILNIATESGNNPSMDKETGIYAVFYEPCRNDLFTVYDDYELLED